MSKIKFEINQDDLNRLAKRLHERMEKLDPSEDENWEEMSELNKDFYRDLCKTIVLELIEMGASKAVHAQFYQETLS